MENSNNSKRRLLIRNQKRRLLLYLLPLSSSLFTFSRTPRFIPLLCLYKPSSRFPPRSSPPSLSLSLAPRLLAILSLSEAPFFCLLLS
ncbi:hypothetical protein Bca4012_018196 [Brassica carinata]